MSRVGKRRSLSVELDQADEWSYSNTFVLIFKKTFKAHPIIASLWLQTVDDWLQMQQLPFSPFLFKLFLDDIKEIVGLCHDLVQHVQTRFWGSSHIAKHETSARWPGLLVGDVTGAACGRLAAFLDGKGAVAGDRGCRLAAMPHKCQLLKETSSGVEPGGSQDAGRRQVSWGTMLIKQWRKRKSFRESAPQCPSWMERLLSNLYLSDKEETGNQDTPFLPDRGGSLTLGRNPSGAQHCLSVRSWVWFTWTIRALEKSCFYRCWWPCERKSPMLGGSAALLSPPSTPRQKHGRVGDSVWGWSWG